MQCKRYEDFMREYQYYRSFLWKYRKTGRAFKDFYFHPKLKIKEPKIKLDWSKIEWKRVDEVYQAPLFDPKLINIDYIKQGSLGDCYFISALLRIAKQPDLVSKLFDKTPDTILGRIKNSINIKCGAVVIFFHAFGRETPVLIDTYLPFYKGTTTLAFSHPSNIHVSPWFCLVEKAYAKLFGSYSSISGGNFTHSIYSLFGYQPRHITVAGLLQDFQVSKKSPFDRLFEYQSQGGVMSCDIEYNSKSEQQLKNVGLVSNHAYLLLKVVDFKGKHFFNLRNPWGKFEWKGDWSDNSPLWSKEYREGLKHKKNQEDGAFWMIEKDFLNYFTSIDISRPIPTDWHSKTFSLEMRPGSWDGCQVESDQCHLEKRPNYALKINEKVPSGKKVELFLMFERRSYFPDEVKFVDHKPGKYIFLFVMSNGRKLTQTVLKHSNRFYLSLSSNITSYKYTLNNPGELLTFAVQRIDKSDVFDECSIRVTCRYDFSLYEIGKQSEMIDDNDITGKIFTTVTGVHKLIASSHRNKDAERKFDKFGKKRIDGDDDDRKSAVGSKDDMKKRSKSVDEKNIGKKSRFDVVDKKDADKRRRDDRNDDQKKDDRKRKSIRPKIKKISNSSSDDDDDDDRKISDKNKDDDDDDDEENEAEKLRMKKKEQNIKKERFRIQREVNQKAYEQMKLKDEINEIEDQIDAETDKKKIAQLDKKIDQKRNQLEDLEEKIMQMLDQLDEKEKELENAMNKNEGKDKKDKKDIIKEKPKPDSKLKPKPHDQYDKPKQSDKKDDKNKPKKRGKSVPKPKIKPID